MKRVQQVVKGVKVGVVKVDLDQVQFQPVVHPIQVEVVVLVVMQAAPRPHLAPAVPGSLLFGYE
jgi:hypothetical protein